MTPSEMRRALIKARTDGTDDEWLAMKSATKQITGSHFFLLGVIQTASDEQVRAIYHQYLINLLIGQTQ